MPPESSVLGNETFRLLKELIATNPTNVAFPIERSGFLAMMESHPEWVASSLDLGTSIQCLPNDPWALCLLYSKMGHRIVVTSSDFVVYAVDKNMKCRQRSINNCFAKMKLLELG